jgi:N4-gp56 family major capsid protein
LEGNEEALSFYSDSVLINQIRHAVRSAGKMSEQRVPYSVREEARQGLSDWLSERYDTAFFNQIAGNTNNADTKYSGNNSTTAPDTAHAIFSGGTAEASLTASASSAFVLTLIDKAVLTAKLNSPSVRPVRVNGENKYVMFIHPYAHYQLRTQGAAGQYMDIQKAALSARNESNNPIYTGALGEYNGVVLHEAVRIPWGTSVTNTFSPQNYLATASVARNVLCGAQSAVMAFGQDTSTGLQASWREEMFDFGNQLGIAAGVIYGLKKCIFNSKDFGTVTVSTFSPVPS